MAYYPALKTPRGGQNVHLHFIDAQSLKLQIVKANVSHPRSKHFKIKNKTNATNCLYNYQFFTHNNIFIYRSYPSWKVFACPIDCSNFMEKRGMNSCVLSVIRLSSLLRRLCSVASCQKLAKQNLPEQLLSNVS